MCRHTYTQTHSDIYAHTHICIDMCKSVYLYPEAAGHAMYVQSGTKAKTIYG